MAWSKKRVMRRKPRKGTRRTRVRRRSRFTRMPRRINSGYTTVSRWLPAAQLTFTTQTYFQGFSYTANMMSDWTALTALYDQYKIKTVVVRFRLTIPPEAANVPNSATLGNANTIYPDIVATVDHDDNNTPTSMDQLCQYSKSKTGVLKPNSWFYYRFHPTASAQIYNGVTSGYGVVSKMWLDAASDAIPHYALKIGIDTRIGATLIQTMAVEYQVKMTVAMKALR